MSFFPLIVVMAVGLWIWNDGLRAREVVLIACRRACERLDVQLLDDTVFLKHMSVARTRRGRLVFRRVYAFEFSITGGARYPGHVEVLGRAVQLLSLDYPEGRVFDTQVSGYEGPGA